MTIDNIMKGLTAFHLLRHKGLLTPRGHGFVLLQTALVLPSTESYDVILLKQHLESRGVAGSQISGDLPNSGIFRK